ncbi:MAG: hypothetical protein ABSG53_31035 [Thermoguttaceae bacterium]|jgi:hypothetical protein
MSHRDPLSGNPKAKKDPESPPSSPPAAPTLEEIIAQQAENLKDVTGASQMYIAVSSSIAPQISTAAFKIYRQKLLEQAGSPTDPIEIMLIEQIALAHFHIGRLHLKSCSTAQAPLAVAYTDAATRLTAEFRRSALALEDYRAKQIARCQAMTGGVPVQEPETKTTPERMSKARKKETTAKMKLTATKEMPEWLRKRVNPTLDESSLVASVN